METEEAEIPSLRRVPALVMVVLWMVLGIGLDRLAGFSAGVYFAGAVASLVAWGLVRWSMTHERTASLSSVLLGLSVALLAGAWHHDRYTLFLADDLGLLQGEFPQPVCLEAEVMQTPRVRSAPAPSALRIIPQGDVTDLVVWVRRIRTAQGWQKGSGWADVSVQGHLLGVEAGDTLQILGESSCPRGVLNPGEVDFSYFQRSRRTMVRVRVDFPEAVSRVRQGSWFSVRRWIGRIRSAGLASLRQHIAPERSHLAAAILLGAREQLETEQNQEFLVTGTIHVLSISGLHVGILAYGFWLLFRTGIFPRRGALWGAMVASLLYAALTGAEPPVMRATIMVQVICVAMLLSRRPDATTSLALAALVVLLLNPTSLFSTGTQLSFLAVCVMFGLESWLAKKRVTDPLDRLVAVTRPWHERLLSRVGESVYRVTMTGVLVWVTALPLVWHQYHLVSPVAVPLGPVVWIPISITLFAGFGVLLFASFAPPLAALCGLITDWSLQVIEVAIHYGRWPPGSFVWLPSPPLWWVLIFYGGVACVLVFPRWQRHKRLLAGLVCVWSLIAYGLATQISGEVAEHEVVKPHATSSPQNGEAWGELNCTFVAVGHGTSVLVEFPSGKRLLYDAGRMGTPQSAIRPIASVLWERGITHLDGLMISHADSDHFCAVPEVLQRFSVGAIYISPPMRGNREPAMRELYRAIEVAKVPVVELSSGSDFAMDEQVQAEILHPPPQGVEGSDNANSLVLLLTFAGKSLLLPGDLESPGLEDLLQKQSRQCDVIMAPHHGSRRSDPTGLALWARPEWVVISGKRDREDVANIERVKDSYEARGALALHTAECGAIRVIMTRDGVRVKTFLPYSAPSR